MISKKFIGLILIFITSIWVPAIVWDRSDFEYHLIGFAIAFVTYLIIYKNHTSRLIDVVALAVLARLGLIFIFPWLSDDVHRFLWDGLLILDGVNPYSHLPSGIIAGGSIDLNIYEPIYSQLNSPDYFSVYPPLAQVLFMSSAFISGPDIRIFSVILKAFFFLIELGVFTVLAKSLKSKSLSKKALTLYALNPLVLIEGVGNLHFEIPMILFALLAYQFSEKGNLIKSGVFIAFSVAIKLVSAIIWPIFISVLGFRKWLKATVILGGLLTFFFLPVVLKNSRQFTESLDLYFRTFEFNASFYYVFREIGHLLMGYNPIAIVGPGLAVVSGICLVIVYYLHIIRKKWSPPQAIIVLLTIYLLFSTTVHPWYILLPLSFVPFTKIRYPIYWSGFMFLSYTAYMFNPVQELWWILIIEYGILILTIFLDINQGALNFHPKQKEIDRRF